MSATRLRADAQLAAEIAVRLDAGLQAMGQAANPLQRRQLLDYLALLHRWNAVYNLTSIRDPLDMLSVHVLDSLSIVPLVMRYPGVELLDVGSGAGLPAIPLAIQDPPRIVQSVDAVAKKIGFQLQAKASLGLPNFSPIHQRIEALTLVKKPRLIVSRAYADLSQMLASIDHIADCDTTVLAMKGAVPDAEIAKLPPAWHVQALEPLDVPFLGARRCAVILQRSA